MCSTAATKDSYGRKKSHWPASLVLRTLPPFVPSSLPSFLFVMSASTLPFLLYLLYHLHNYHRHLILHLHYLHLHRAHGQNASSVSGEGGGGEARIEFEAPLKDSSSSFAPTIIPPKKNVRGPVPVKLPFHFFCFLNEYVYRSSLILGQLFIFCACDTLSP